MNSVSSRGLVIVVLIVSAIYTGLLLGVAFLATPVKFLATSLELPVALEIGRYTFAALNKAEWALGSVLLLCCLMARGGGL